MKPDNSGYSGAAVFENKDGTVLRLNLNGVSQEPCQWEKSTNTSE